MSQPPQEDDNSHHFWTQLMVEQLLKQGWAPEFYDQHVDGVNLASWERSGRDLNKLHLMELDINPSHTRPQSPGERDPRASDSLFDGVTLRLFDDGALTLDIEKRETRAYMNRRFRHPLTGRLFYSGTHNQSRGLTNPLGATLQYFDVGERAYRAEDQPHFVTGTTSVPFDIEVLDRFVREATRTYTGSRRRNRTRTPDM